MEMMDEMMAMEEGGGWRMVGSGGRRWMTIIIIRRRHSGNNAYLGGCSLDSHHPVTTAHHTRLRVQRFVIQLLMTFRRVEYSGLNKINHPPSKRAETAVAVSRITQYNSISFVVDGGGWIVVGQGDTNCNDHGSVIICRFLIISHRRYSYHL